MIDSSGRFHFPFQGVPGPLTGFRLGAQNTEKPIFASLGRVILSYFLKIIEQKKYILTILMPFSWFFGGGMHRLEFKYQI